MYVSQSIFELSPAKRLCIFLMGIVAVISMLITLQNVNDIREAQQMKDYPKASKKKVYPFQSDEIDPRFTIETIEDRMR